MEWFDSCKTLHSGTTKKFKKFENDMIQLRQSLKQREATSHHGGGDVPVAGGHRGSSQKHYSHHFVPIKKCSTWFL